MNEDGKMFQIGFWMMLGVVMLMVALQVCYRTQNRALARVRRDNVQVQQQIAAATANFASYVRPEVLRNIVTGVFPRAEVVGFQKTVTIDQLPLRGDE